MSAPKARGAGKNPDKKPRRQLGPGLKPGNPGNSGGKKGRSGRKPLEFVTECAGLADGIVLAKVGRYLRGKKNGPGDQAWRWCAEYVTRYTKTEPRKLVEHGGSVSIEHVLREVSVDDDSGDAATA